MGIAYIVPIKIRRECQPLELLCLQNRFEMGFSDLFSGSRTLL